MAKAGFHYLSVSLFCVLFGAVYEYFSHEVYSYFMLYAFVFPLCGGALPFTALALGRTVKMPSFLPRQLYHFGIATLTVGSVMKGVLEIYGTTNDLTSIYWYVGIPLIVAALGLYSIGLFSKRISEK